MRTSRPLVAALGLAALLGAGTATTPAWADDANGTSHSYGYDNNENKKPKKGALPACADIVDGGAFYTSGGALSAGVTLLADACSDVTYALVLTSTSDGAVTTLSTPAVDGVNVVWGEQFTMPGAPCFRVEAKTLDAAGGLLDESHDDSAGEELCPNDGGGGTVAWR